MSIDPGDIMGNYGNASFRRQRERREDTLIIDHLSRLELDWHRCVRDLKRGLWLPSPDPQAHYYVSLLHCNAFVWLN